MTSGGPSLVSSLLLDILPWEHVAVIERRAVEDIRVGLETLLTSEERRHLAALANQRRKREFLGGRALAKACVRSVATPPGPDFGDMDVLSDDSGAPVLLIGKQPQEAISVSISHGGDYLMAAAAKGHGVGVDLERVGQKAAGLRASFASESEQDLLERGAGDADAVARAYTALFSAKEAAAKCLGTHMYHAFYYLRLVETGRGRLVLENIAESPKRRIIARACFHAGHVFSLVDGVDMRPVTGTE